MKTAAYGGRTYLADTSARVRVHHPSLRDEWAAAVRSHQIVTCSITTLELLYSARNAHELRELEVGEATLRDVPVTVSVQRTAIAALRDLSDRGAGYHRVKLPDVLIAAAAQHAGIGVLHYDHHYDRLAEVLDFDSRWIAEPGTL
ncbi:MAG: hypothetical protein QOD61_1258 [Solirubrobacteraceae bacterium]|nr:hypothetical protein [Solirubrobacteraceae bacterium]